MTKDIPLSINNVSIGYDDKIVANDLSFDVSSGEVFGFIGLNGEGKTTLIKTILGLREPLSGDIKVFGSDRSDKSFKKNLAYLPEKFMPSWFMTGREFIRFSTSLYSKEVDDEKVNSMAENFSLDVGMLSKRIKNYSKGMAQKLGLMSVILTETPLLILDEPMSGLDPFARVRVKEALEKSKAMGQTIFLSSHILSDLDELCDRIAVLDSGEIKYVGNPGDLKKKTKEKTLEKAFLSIVNRV